MASIYDNSEIIGVFLDEVEEQLQLLDESILDLEQRGETPEVIQKIFRVAHTLKGSSSAVGFEKMKQLTHEMEDVLDKIRNKLLKTTKAVVNLLFQCADHLRLLKNDYLTNSKDIKTDISQILRDLKDITRDGVANMGSFEGTVAKDNGEEASGVGPIFNLDHEKQQLLEQAKGSGINNLVCEIKIVDQSHMKLIRFCLILNYLNELGTVIDIYPNILELPEGSEVKEVSYLLATELTREAMQFKAGLEIMDIDKIKVYTYLSDKCKAENLEHRTTDDINVAHNVHSLPQTDKKVNQTVRVDVERLEKMMNLVGELVIEQTRIAQAGNILYNKYPSDHDVDNLMGISNQVHRIIGELQEGVMKARMLPIQQLYNRFPRMVRDLGESLDKEVDLILEGGETEMDRTIIEDINDPLIHIIRNAIDHGLEKKEDRIKLGKPEKGILKISASHQENHVILTIQDDGAGIDVEKVKTSAVKKKLITKQESENLSEQDAINLIFHNGFSTAQRVSDVSGRGVGMDIVKNHINKLNGIIDIETKLGFGTKIIVKLPLTLAILTGLLVKINNDIFALPMSNVLEIVRKPQNEIESIKGQSVAVIRDRVLPLVWLHDYFGVPRCDGGKNVFILVLGVAEKRLGLVVDGLIGNQEIVVKPLGSYIGKVEGFSGATILGDGSVACILDVVGVSKMVISRKPQRIVIN